MKIFLEESALTYAYYDNYPEITFRIESAGLESITDSIRVAKGYAPLFQDHNQRCQDGGWYDFYIIINAETETIKTIWAEIHGEVDEKECPDHNENIYLDMESKNFKSICPNASDLVRQIKNQLRNRYDVSLTDLKSEVIA